MAFMCLPLDKYSAGILDIELIDTGLMFICGLGSHDERIVSLPPG